MKKIFERRLELAYKGAYAAKTVKEFYFFVNVINELKNLLEEG